MFSQHAHACTYLYRTYIVLPCRKVASKGIVNSMTNPDAWAFLYRLVKASDNGREAVDPEVVRDWKAGGTARSKLLTQFVDRVYVPGGEHRTNTLRLEAFIKIRQATRDWRSSLKGYEWLTEEELQTKHSWPEKLGQSLDHWFLRMKAILFDFSGRYMAQSFLSK